MVEFFAEYGLFLAKIVTVVVAFGVVVAIAAAAGGRGNKTSDGEVDFSSLNEDFDQTKDNALSVLMSDEEYKAHKKSLSKTEKEDKKRKKKAGNSNQEVRKRVFVLDFDGDIQASEVENLRHEVSAILMVARDGDEVVVNVESAGGMVHTYGLAASQLQRIKDQGLKLTVCVDKVAASGGYLMACLGDKLYAAPFAIVGSIGVLAQIPNFHRVLKKYDVDYDILTAGEHKQSMTMFGHNTEKMKEKLVDDLQDTHELFKSFVSERRPQLDIASVATGEIWYGQRALAVNLVDELKTSDSLLLEQSKDADLYRVAYKEKQSLQDRIGNMIQHAVDKSLNTVMKKATESRIGHF